MSKKLGTFVIVGLLLLVAGVLYFYRTSLSKAAGAVTATIQLRQAGTSCRAETSPHRIVIQRNGRVTWSVTGQCEGIDANQVEVRFVGDCQADGSKRAGPVPDLFNEPPPHRGRTIIRNLKYGERRCVTYAVLHGTTTLEDPEFEIVF